MQPQTEAFLTLQRRQNLFKLTENTCQRGLYAAKNHGRTDSKNRNETVGNRHELLRGRFSYEQKQSRNLKGKCGRTPLPQASVRRRPCELRKQHCRILQEQKARE